MKKIFTACFTLLFTSALAQSNTSVFAPDWQNQAATCTFPGTSLPGGTAAEIADQAHSYLKNNLPSLKNENTELQLVSDITSRYARYISYVQTFRDYPIAGTSVIITIDKQNKVSTLVSKTAMVNNWSPDVAIPDADAKQMANAIGSYDHSNFTKKWYYNEYQGIPVYEINAWNDNGSKSDRIWLTTGYQVLDVHSVLKHYKYPDSLVKAYVFYPDPLTSAMSPYQEPLTNHNDSDVAALDAQMTPKDLHVSVVNDSFFLENEFARISDFAPPHTSATYSKSSVFHYKRDSSAFRDLMVYYHINNQRTHFKAIGYDSLGHTQISLDGSGLYDDNSTFDHQGYPKIYFGIGGVPDAEDADVPIHEYTHFLSFSACPKCSESGQEREALDEGTADFMAASYSKAISTYNWEKVYNWDGNIGSWQGRSCAVSDIYPAGLKTGDIHLEGQMWSSALMEIWDQLGRDKTEQIMLETLYTLGPDLTMKSAAKIYCHNDSLMFQGADIYTIAHYFIKRGFLPESYLGIAPVNYQTGFKIITAQFPVSGKVMLDFEEPQTGTLSLYDVTGRLIGTKNISKAYQADFTDAGLSGGMYILQVNTNGLQKSFKLVR